MLASGVGMAIVDLDGRWVEVNPAFERMFGYPAGALVGRAATELTHPEDLDAVHAAFARALKGGEPTLDAEQRYLRRNGEVVWAQANVAVMQNEDGQPNYLVVHLHDVSAQHAADQALQARNQALESQLQAMGQRQEAFAYGISHDLRAPLRAIESFAGLLDARVRAPLDETSRDYLAAHPRRRGTHGRPDRRPAAAVARRPHRIPGRAGGHQPASRLDLRRTAGRRARTRGADRGRAPACW